MKQNPVILDTDPGIDDAVAIMVLYHFCPERVAFLLTTYGNVSLEHTTNNALTMRSLLDWDVDVIKGTSHPVSERIIEASHIHGKDGLGGLGLSFEKGSAVEGDYLQKVYDRILSLGTVDYITIGPLTNLALLLQRFPDVKQHIERVVTMGGGIGMGNVTKDAEFNIYCDPQSAGYVFYEISDLVLVPLNVTSNVALSLEQIDEMTKRDTPMCEAMRKILTANYHACVGYGEAGSTMHDSTAVFYYLHPEWFTAQKCGIAVDCDERYGMTTVNETKQNITLLKSVQSEILLTKIAECI